MKKTIKSIILVLIAMASLSLYSCSNRNGDNPEPKQQMGVRKKMSVVITATGNLDSHTMNIIVMAISKIGDSATLPMASPVIDDRDGNSYSQIVYQKGDFENVKAVSAHSKDKVAGIYVVLTMGALEQNVKGNITINIKTYAAGKMVDERTYKSTDELYQKAYQVLSDNE